MSKPSKAKVLESRFFEDARGRSLGVRLVWHEGKALYRVTARWGKSPRRASGLEGSGCLVEVDGNEADARKAFAEQCKAAEAMGWTLAAERHGGQGPRMVDLPKPYKRTGRKPRADAVRRKK